MRRGKKNPFQKEIERKYIIETDNLNIDEIIDIIDNDNKFYIGEKYE